VLERPSRPLRGRLALVENEQRIRQAARGVRRFFETADATLHNVVKLKKQA
jgi:alanine-synthesizing transaminase